jgi:hypothetical protein
LKGEFRSLGQEGGARGCFKGKTLHRLANSGIPAVCVESVVVF